MQQRAIPVMPCALEKQGRGNVQIYHPPCFVQSPTIFRVQYDASTGSHHDIGCLRQLVNGLHFSSPETIFAFNFEDCWDRYTCPLNYFMI